MSIRISIFVILALYLAALNVRDLNQRRVSISEFFVWQASIAFLSILLLWNGASKEISNRLGFEIPSNLVFSFIIGSLVLNIKILSKKIAQQKKQIQCIAEKIALNLEN